MTLVTVNAVVDVARHLLVLEIVGVVPAVASRALEHRIVIRVRMARGANIVRVTVAGWEWRVLRVVKRRVGPCRRVVASLARCREELRLRRVSRICRVVVIGLVAAKARRGQRCVIVVYVAVGALSRRHQVRTSKGEGRVVVIKGRVRPRRGVVAEFASCRKPSRSVRGIVSVGVILLVA